MEDTKKVEENGLPKPSAEQQLVIDDLVAGKNVIVNSAAGSGKTTCILQACMNLDKKEHILILAYNARLRKETEARVGKMPPEVGNKIEVHTYHSFARKYFGVMDHTDGGIHSSLAMESPLEPILIDLLVLDEQQDMIPLYHEFISRVLAHNLLGKEVQLCLFGDVYQTIYGFKGADSRFLTHANILYGRYSNRAWGSRRLLQSF